MILKRLSVINYKNIREATISLSSKLNCFIGSNGVGKTNVLDAVHYLSFCRSAFNPIDAQVITHNQDFFVLDGKYLSDEGDEERRRLLDVVISQYDHAYIEALSAYNKALQQRNALLKMEEEPDKALLEIWEEQMALNGEIIYQKRNSFVERLVPVFQDIYTHISGGHEIVALNYVSHGQRGPLLDTIQRDRHRDRAVGYSLHGVHRDDLEMLLDGYQMKREGSQGQHKTYALALKLAQFDFLRRTSHNTPLLLLDDIFDKLDANRVEKIVQLVGGDEFGQIFITDTNRDHLDQILARGDFDYKLFSVDNGEIEEKN